MIYRPQFRFQFSQNIKVGHRHLPPPTSNFLILFSSAPFPPSQTSDYLNLLVKGLLPGVVSFSISECFSCLRLPGYLAWRARVKHRAEHLGLRRGAHAGEGAGIISKMPGQHGCSGFAPGRFQRSLDRCSSPPPPSESINSGPARGKGGLEALLKQARTSSLGLPLGNNDTCKPIAVSVSVVRYCA